MKKAGDEFVFRPLDLVTVKGRSQSVRIYQLLGKSSDDNASENKRLAKLTEEALEVYLQREWRQAYELFQMILADFKDDYIAEMYMIRCRELNENPPGRNWNGVFNVLSKG
jgi:adenylate cyclase